MRYIRREVRKPDSKVYGVPIGMNVPHNFQNMAWRLAVGVLWASFLLSPLRTMAQNGQIHLPDGVGKQAVQKVCGTCDGLEVAVAVRHTQNSWQQVVGDMVTRGATGTDAEPQAAVTYMTANFGATNGPQQGAAPAPANGQGGRGGRGSTGAEAAGQIPKDITALSSFDMAAVERGGQVFSAQCASCHGSDARGGNGLTEVDLILSQLVLDDVRGADLDGFLKVGRPDKNMPKFDLEQAQVSDLAEWLHYTISKDTLRGYYVKLNVFSGDAKAGEAFFNGSVGKCNTCHSATGDMKGVAAKYNHDNPSILSAIVTGGGGSGGGRGGRGGGGRGGPGAPAEGAPPSATAITATVTLASGEKVVGYPDLVDDFVVEIRLPSGQTRTWLREGEWPKVTLTNPLQAHVDLLFKYADADLHNLSAYLESLK